jgi:hypothetical protein
VQRCMLRMPALIHHRRLRLLALKNRHQGSTSRVMLSKMITKPTLSAMKCLHTAPPLQIWSRRASPLHDL